jgi:hypothetical protein
VDPNAALRMIDEADRVDVETREVMRGLHGWLSRGGFQPDWDDYPTGTRRYHRAYGKATSAVGQVGHSTRVHATVAKAPIGMRNIATTYQLAYETYDGNVQVRKIGDRLWEVLPRGGASFYEKSRQAAIERAFQLDASRSARKATRRTRR